MDKTEKKLLQKFFPCKFFTFGLPSSNHNANCLISPTKSFLARNAVYSPIKKTQSLIILSITKTCIALARKKKSKKYLRILPSSQYLRKFKNNLLV